MLRRPNRHIDIVSMSALDLFASALGAFIMVAIILFPYYLNDRETDDRLAKAGSQLAETERKLAGALAQLNALQAPSGTAPKAQDPVEIAQLQRRSEMCEAEMSRPFLAVGITWATPDADIDLHVTDPEGHEFYFFRNNENRRDFPDSAAELSYDMTTGPAVELWQNPSASPGEYSIDYVANSIPVGYDVEVRGSVFERRGKRELPRRILRRSQERVHAGTITVGSDGSVALR
jgi:hypothetical protein